MTLGLARSSDSIRIGAIKSAAGTNHSDAVGRFGLTSLKASQITANSPSSIAGTRPAKGVLNLRANSGEGQNHAAELMRMKLH